MARPQRLVFGEDADLYDAARPSYPASLVDDVIEMVGTSAQALDVGCGTAKATVLLAERGLTGVGVEADPAMAAVAQRNLAPFPGWHVEISDFEKWEPTPTGAAPPPTGAAPDDGYGDYGFDLVTSAQAWHWLDPEVRTRKAHRLLRTGGWLTVWWNIPSDADTPMRAAMDDLYQRLAPELPSQGIGSKSNPGPSDTPADLSFGKAIYRSYNWSMEYSSQQWASLLQTQSDHRMLPPGRLAQLVAEMTSLIDSHGGTYRHTYTCSMWALRKE